MVNRALQELRAARAKGGSRLHTFEVAGSSKVYDELDEEDYKKVVRKRLDEDDFVVDDNGAGYADDGREEWMHEPQEEDVSDEEAPRGKAGRYHIGLANSGCCVKTCIYVEIHMAVSPPEMVTSWSKHERNLPLGIVLSDRCSRAVVNLCPHCPFRPSRPLSNIFSAELSMVQ